MTGQLTDQGQAKGTSGGEKACLREGLRLSYKAIGRWSWTHLKEKEMTDHEPPPVQAQVRAQFDRQVSHYGQSSAMADQQLLDLIVRMAGPTSGRRV
jgi:hypothetical protein